MIELQKIKYHIFHPQNTLNNTSMIISEKTYDFWVKFWSDFFAANGVKNDLNRSSFKKQDIIASITCEGEVIGSHLYTLFNLDSKLFLEDSYLKILPKNKVHQFAEHNLKTGIAMEYLAVAPDFRKSKSGINFGDVFIGLGLNIMDELNLDCVFGVATKDAKVNKMSERFGGISFCDEIKLMKKDCSFSVIKKSNRIPHPNPFTQKLIDKLWQDKENYLLYFDTTEKYVDKRNEMKAG